MTKNVGTTDSAIRAAVGVTLIALAASGVIGLWGFIGVIPILTAGMGWCPPYALLGWNTCENRA